MVPGGCIVLGAAILGYMSWLSLPMPALTFLTYCGLVGGAALGWRFHSSRVFFALVLILIAHQVLGGLGASPHGLSPATEVAFRAIAFLLPLNYALICLMEERGLTRASAVPFSVFLFVQGVIVAVLCRSAEALPSSSLHLRHAHSVLSIPVYTAVAFAVAGVVALTKFIFTRKTLDGSFLWSLLALFLALHSFKSNTLAEMFWAVAGWVLAFSIIENSYLLAYHDELTGLPSRRAFNEMTMRLQPSYCLAVVDIDHFKRFNDTYGHDVGDQVLRLVASKLAGVTGGGHAFRCGGEEFNIVFSGKKIADVTDHLERLRKVIEASEFHMRGHDRRQTPRGPDRRKERTAKGRKKNTDAIPDTVHLGKPAALSVTVSIGVAMSDAQLSNPSDVLLDADKALYRAKEGGRNRVEVASPKRKSKAKTAGIA